MKNKIKIYLLLIAVGIGSVSCLDKYPDDAIQAGQAIKQWTMLIRQLLASMRHLRMLRSIADV